MNIKTSCILIILAAAFTSCKHDTLPAEHGMVLTPPGSAHDPLPSGRYDAIFDCEGGMFRDNKSSSPSASDASAWFSDSNRPIRMPATVSVRVNRNLLTRGTGRKVPINFPDPVTWQIEGNEHFPSLTHTIASIAPIVFMSPDEAKPLSISDSTEVRYSAPGLDSVQFLISYRGEGVIRRDMKKLEQTGQDYYKTVPNTGRYVMGPFVTNDKAFESFTPKSVLVIILWSRGDTVHVGPYVYGFVNRCSCLRKFMLKP
jgi:hypothetical protein